MTSTCAVVGSPIGPLTLVARDDRLAGVYLPGHRPAPAGPLPEPGPLTGTVLPAAAEQLAAYFAGERTAFDLPLAPAATAFAARVRAGLMRIGYGATTTYAALAADIGAARAVRAVGHANAHNPLSIVVPCHRVLGARGALTGYAGGLQRKRALLELEGALLGVAA